MGGFGGGQQAQAPTLNVGKTLKLNEGQLKLLNEYAPVIAQTLGDTSRSQNTQNTLYGLNMLTRPNATLNREQIAPIQERMQKTQGKIKDLRQELKGAGNKRKQEIRREIGNLQDRVKTQRGRIADIRDNRPLQQLQKTFSKEFAQRDALLGEMEGAIPSTAEYRRLQQRLGAGVKAQTVDRGTLGESLYQTAMERAQSDGRLSAEAERDAVQAARSGMAARGMATGSAGLGAELLNRDRYARARQAEDLAFAQGVQTEDLGRRQFNAGMIDSTNRYNMGLLADSANYADAERARKLNTRQNIYNFSLASNPRMMLAGVGSPYANMTQNANASVTGLTANVTPSYSGGQFSGSKGSGWHTQISGLVGAGFGAYFGGPAGATAGYSAGSSLGAASEGTFMDPFSWSDKRMKTDIKKIDGPTNVIGIPAYEYRYKGEKKKRKGVMAQDVQKVLPEAVAEFDYKGKKRLAIRPAVIGAALAEQLAEDTKPVALAS
jgi:hypothetical protein